MTAGNSEQRILHEVWKLPKTRGMESTTCPPAGLALISGRELPIVKCHSKIELYRLKKNTIGTKKGLISKQRRHKKRGEKLKYTHKKDAQ
jgi:hypothetical protein